jgi:hypothetical protein
MEFDYFEEKVHSEISGTRYIIGFVSKRSIVSERLASNRRSTDAYLHLSKNGLLERRTALINWVRNTIQHPYLSDASISNAVELIDKYVLEHTFDDRTMYSIGAAALLISSKWHDDNNLQIGDIPSIRKELSVNRAHRAEVKMVNYFDWKIEEVTPYAYLANCNLQPKVRPLALYLSRLFSITDMYLVNSPLEIAAICVFIANRLYNVAPAGIDLIEVEMLIDVSANELEETFDIISVYSRKYKSIDSKAWEDLMGKYLSFE